MPTTSNSTHAKSGQRLWYYQLNKQNYPSNVHDKQFQGRTDFVPESMSGWSWGENKYVNVSPRARNSMVIVFTNISPQWELISPQLKIFCRCMFELIFLFKLITILCHSYNTNRAHISYQAWNRSGVRVQTDWHLCKYVIRRSIIIIQRGGTVADSIDSADYCSLVNQLQWHRIQ